MSKPLGYFTGYNPANPDATPLLHEIQEGFGSCFEKMDLRSKLMLRSALCTYQLQCHLGETYGRKPNPKRTIQDAIESNDSDAWDELEKLTDWLQDFVVAEEQTEHQQGNIEGFIRFLTEAINA